MACASFMSRCLHNAKQLYHLFYLSSHSKATVCMVMQNEENSLCGLKNAGLPPCSSICLSSTHPSVHESDTSVCLSARYKPLREKLIRSGWWAKIHPIQVGSRGLLDVASFGPLLKLTACSNKRSQQSLLTQLSRISLCCSFAIWCKWNKKDWEDRPLFD